MAEKLEVRHDPTGFFGESEWELWNGEQLIGSVVSSEADAHECAAAGMMREALKRWLKDDAGHCYCEGDSVCNKCATEAALAAARVPEGG